MAAFTDQTGRTIELPQAPRRIISVVPSQTELLFHLGLDEKVTGITKFCVHPEEWFRTKTRVGGTKQVKMDIVHRLQPDLIIANREENVKEQVEELASRYPVWISDVNTLEDAYAMIREIGKLTGKEEASGKLVDQIRENFSGLSAHTSGPKTCYLIWRGPWMTVGGDTFIHSMLEAAGFANIFQHRRRYPEVTADELKAAGCQLLLLASEPFPFRQQHKEELKAILPGTKIMLVDGELFSWYGSRLLLAPGYFKKLKAEWG